MSDWPYGEPFQFGSLSCTEIIKKIFEDVFGSEQEPKAHVVEGSIAPVIDDPSRLLPEKENAHEPTP